MTPHSSASSITVRSSSRRINGRACISCHHRKIRCDILEKGAPCSKCITHNRPGCSIYEKKKHRQNLSRRREPVSIRPQVPIKISAKDKTPDHSLEASPVDDSATSFSKDEDEENDPGNFSDLIDNQNARTGQLDYNSRVCFVGSGLSNCHYLMRQILQPGRENTFHFGARQYSRDDTSHELKRIPPEVFERPSKPVADKLVRAYFEKINRGWPVIDEEAFMSHYEKNDQRNPVPLPLLNAVWMVGAHVLSAEDDTMKPLRSVFFRRAKYMVDFRIEQDRTAYVQVALLMTWYSDGLEEIIANAWHWIGMATRTALGMGVHRDASQANMEPSYKRTYTRLWWILFQFDTIVSASLGRPQYLNLDDSDVPELNPDHFEGVPNAEVDFQIHQSKLCMIISRTVRAGFSLRSSAEARLKAVRTADEALAIFLRQLPPKLQLPATNHNNWQSVLHLTYNNFVILLHRQPPKNSPFETEAASCSQPSLCTGATLAIVSILESLRSQNAMSSLWYDTNHVIFTSIINASTDIASSNPLAVAESQRMFQSLLNSLREFSRFWRYGQCLFHMFQQRALRLKAGLSEPALESSHSDAVVHSSTIRTRSTAQDLIPNDRVNEIDNTDHFDSNKRMLFESNSSDTDFMNSLLMPDAEVDWSLLGMDETLVLNDMFALNPFDFDESWKISKGSTGRVDESSA